MASDMVERARRRAKIEHIFAEADRHARMMGCRFVIDPRKLRMFVRAQVIQENSHVG